MPGKPSQKNTDPFLGNDICLSKAIHQHKFDVTAIPEHYNRFYTDPLIVCPSTQVIHFHGPAGKLALLCEIMLHTTLSK